MKVAVLPNLDKYGTKELVEKLGTYLRSCGIEPYLPDSICSSGYTALPEKDLFNVADLIITIGGDGTIIRYGKRAAECDKPILGINAGRMGYLADIEQDEYTLLKNLASGDYTVENRMMLDIEVFESGNQTGSFTALNDAVITGGFISRIIDISANVEGDNVSYRADGLVIATPTGSTAYSMSAGGPIIDPKMDCFCITPICSFALASKPIILGGEQTVKFKAFSKKRIEIYLSVDGRRAAIIKPQTEVIIKKSEKTVKLIRLKDHSFYKTLSVKFFDQGGAVRERKQIGKNTSNNQ
ncbi:MAG: NAD(+)/NADH kinase [Clostridia bacterium]|nr:NAD(+)/NADH kinase [Clostridia bacterium]